MLFYCICFIILSLLIDMTLPLGTYYILKNKDILLQFHNIIIKIKKSILILYYIQISPVDHIMSFMAKEKNFLWSNPIQDHVMCLVFFVSLVSFNPELFLTVCLSWPWHLLYRLFLNLGLSDISLWLDSFLAGTPHRQWFILLRCWLVSSLALTLII